MPKTSVVAAAALFLTLAAPVRAEAPVAIGPDDLVATRQSGFDLMGVTAGGMKQAIDAGGDVKPYAAGAKAMARWSAAIPGMFPAGSGTQKSKAKPEIWSDPKGFAKASADFAAEATKLAQIADANDKAGFAQQFKVVGQACGTCHRGYRVKTE